MCLIIKAFWPESYLVTILSAKVLTVIALYTSKKGGQLSSKRRYNAYSTKPTWSYYQCWYVFWAYWTRPSLYFVFHLFKLFIHLLRARSCLGCKSVRVCMQWVVPHTTPCPTILLFMKIVYSFTVPSFPGIYALPVDNGSWTKTEARALSWNGSWKQSTVWKNHQTGIRISHWIWKLFISMI